MLAISPGSSGGGLFDTGPRSNLIGILTSKVADKNTEGIGFAIAADLASGVLNTSCYEQMRRCDGMTLVQMFRINV